MGDPRDTTAGLGGGEEVWRGAVEAWECDEMEHMNVRFYVARATDGLAGLALRLGLATVYAPGARATLVVRDQHIRFLKEARAGAPLHMMAGVLELHERGARVLQVLVHSATGEACATIVSRVDHVAAGGDRAFPWPERARAAAAGLRTALPAYAAPRGLAPPPVELRPDGPASVARADALDLPCIARGGLDVRECDAFGRMRAEQFLGRISGGMKTLFAPLRGVTPADAAHRIGGVALEYRLVYAEWPRAGDHIEVRSAFTALEGKAMRVAHWLLDPASGRAWGTAEAVAARFDLDARTVMALDEAERAVLQPFARPQMLG